MRLLQSVLAGMLALPAFAPVSQFVVVRQSQAGSISLETVEVFGINGRDRVRLFGSASPSLDANTYNRLGKIQLNRAGTIRKDSQGQFVRLEQPGGKRTAVLPDDLKFKGSAKTGDLWKQVAFTFRTHKQDKTETTFGGHEFFALLPASSAPGAAVSFLLEAANFDNFDERLRVLVGVVRSFPKAPETDAVRLFLEKEIQEGYEAFENGGSWEGFLNTVKYAEASQLAYPAAPKLSQLFKDVMERKAATETSLAVLKALLNNRNWDDFLQKHLPFERYQASFPEIVAGRTRALQESARLHVQNGRELRSQKRYLEALREYRFALGRDPNNEQLGKLVEDTRIEASLAGAQQKASLRKVLPKGSPQEIQFNRHLQFAALYIGDRKFDEAGGELSAAMELDKDAPGILLVRAQLHQGRNELAQALSLLNAYDESVATPEERANGEKVRIQVLYKLRNLKSEYKTALDRLYAGGSYSEAYKLAAKCLELDANDEDFLYYSGILAAILRHNERAVPDLKNYLAVSTSLAGDLKKRDRAYHVLTILQAARPVSSKGTPNWLSGRKLPPDIFYCPESLAFQPAIESIKGHKISVEFDWGQDRRLNSITTRFEDEKLKAAMAAGKEADPGSLYFDYHAEFPQVLRISSRKTDAKESKYTDAQFARAAAGGLQLTDGGKSRWQYLTLLGSPLVNPDVLGYLEGPAAIGLAGNSYFNPFVWDGIHIFRLSYDKLARVETAREIGAKNVVRFGWDGDKLQSITAYPSDSFAQEPVYRRTMSYAQDQLVSETVTYNGKTYKIAYKYQANHLVEASFDDNGAHDGHSRHVKFLP